MKRNIIVWLMTLIAMHLCAQEIWNANAVTDLKTAEQTIEATPSITLKIASVLNEKDIEDGKNPWMLEGKEDGSSNTALNTTDCTPPFNQFLKGMGNPYVTDAGGHWEETENGRSWRDDPNASSWAPGCGLLPAHGQYIKVTAKANGSLKMGVYINKGNHPLYVVEESTITALNHSDIQAEFYYQNNGFTFNDNGTTVSFVRGTLPADYIIQHTNGYNQNRPALGYITFAVEAGKSYWVFNPRSQVGLYGLYFSTGESNEVTATLNVSPEGAGSVSPTTVTVLQGTDFTATATAHAGYVFEGWYAGDNCVSTENPHTFTLNSNITLTARFQAQAANTVRGFLDPTCKDMGSVTVSPAGTVTDGGLMFNYGTTITLTATPFTGYRFDHWDDGTGGRLSEDTRYTFEVTSDRTVYAVFVPMENYQPDLVAFPGAEGYGRFTTGGRAIDGRGSKVYYVTRLDDCSDNNLVEGTFRWALRSGDDTPRTILFKVSGTIYLTSRLSASHPNMTIAGQTAPGGGICIAGYQLKLCQPNTIVRYIRFRAGDLPRNSMSSVDTENTHHVIFDHCSFSWSMEENLTLYDTDYTTVQWCIFSEGLYNSRNNKGARSYAAQWGGEHGTLHHCLFASCNSRSPRFNGVRASTNDRHVDSEFINNVVYNWGKRNSIYGGENDVSCNGYNRTYMINNYFRPGPATQRGVTGERWFVGASSSNGVGQWYLSGNKFEIDSKWAPANNNWSREVLEKVNADNLYGFTSDASYKAINLESVGNSQDTYEKYILKTQTASSGMSYESADEAYHAVVRNAGVSLPRYDEVDARVLAEAAGTIDPQYGGSWNNNGKYGIIDSPYDITLSEHDVFGALYEGDKAADNKEIDVTCYPRLQMDSDDCRVIDSDGDGMPDAYELEKGLDPADATDGAKLTDSGYSNLELFLNGVADRTIDATRYTKHQATTQAFTPVIVAQDGSGDYTSIQEAVNHADGTTPYYIFIKKGTYQEHVTINKPNIHLTGQDKQNTIITHDKTIADGNVDNTATVNVTGNDVSFDNLTIRNTRTNEGQALALYTKADRISITSCNLEGWQDTYRTGKKGQRHIVRNCKISGTTDFIYNDGEVFFDSDTLHVLRQSNVITAPAHNGARYGYVFKDAVITSTTHGAQTHLGRPWTDSPKVSFINTRLTEGVTIPAEGWRDMGAYPIQMAEYNTMDAEGKTVDLSQRKTAFTVDGQTKECSKAVLSLIEASNYQLDYILRGDDEWDADWTAFILPAPQLFRHDDKLTWNDPSGFAVAFLLIIDGQATVTTDRECAYQGHETISVQAISAFGVLGEQITDKQASTDIASVNSDYREVIRRQYFNASGQPVNRLCHGVTLICETLSDGTIRSSKVRMK